jgi:hypothetical protein
MLRARYKCCVIYSRFSHSEAGCWSFRFVDAGDNFAHSRKEEGHSCKSFFCWVSASCTRSNYFFSSYVVLGTPCWILVDFSTFLQYLSYLFHIQDFLWISQIWTGSDYNNAIKLVKKGDWWHFVHFEAFLPKRKESLHVLFNKKWSWDYGQIVLKFYKIQMKSKTHEICQDVMVSYVEVVVNSWECFVQITMCATYKPKHLQRSFT